MIKENNIIKTACVLFLTYIHSVQYHKTSNGHKYTVQRSGKVYPIYEYDPRTGVLEVNYSPQNKLLVTHNGDGTATVRQKNPTLRLDFPVTYCNVPDGVLTLLGLPKTPQTSAPLVFNPISNTYNFDEKFLWPSQVFNCCAGLVDCVTPLQTYYTGFGQINGFFFGPCKLYISIDYKNVFVLDSSNKLNPKLYLYSWTTRQYLRTNSKPEIVSEYIESLRYMSDLLQVAISPLIGAAVREKHEFYAVYYHQNGLITVKHQLLGHKYTLSPQEKTINVQYLGFYDKIIVGFADNDNPDYYIKCFGSDESCQIQHCHIPSEVLDIFRLASSKTLAVPLVFDVKEKAYLFKLKFLWPNMIHAKWAYVNYLLSKPDFKPSGKVKYYDQDVCIVWFPEYRATNNSRRIIAFVLDDVAYIKINQPYQYYAVCDLDQQRPSFYQYSSDINGYLKTESPILTIANYVNHLIAKLNQEL